MFVLYDLAVLFSWIFLHLLALFSPKLRQFTTGRKKVLPYLEQHRDPSKPLIWMHAASLGEFEQGAPVLEKLVQQYPGHQFLITFFSPSGYEVKKDRLSPHLVTYLPMDTRSNAREFIRLARPDIALFIKYEVWPGFYRELQREGIPILLFSALFRPGQAYFKWYGGFLRSALRRVSRYYVQDTASARLLKNIGIEQVEVSGDTRFDRVLGILERSGDLPFMETFTRNRTCLVAGSTWPEDHRVLRPFIEAAPENTCVVIAPHKTDPRTVETLEKELSRPSLRYSEIAGADLQQAGVLILDTIGLLTRVYRYADMAYVGGGFATGLHNTLEPAVYGIPVLIGPGFEGFREAEALVSQGGILVVRDATDFSIKAGELMASEKRRGALGDLNAGYIRKNRGATDAIVAGIRDLLV